MNTTNNTPAQQHEEQVAMLQVFTTQQKPAEKQEIVIATTRNGKNEDGSKREVATENRLRCIVIPELSVEGIPSKFQTLVMDALRSMATAQLQSIWKADPAIREVPAAIWSVDSLLLFAAREAESKRLTKQTCEDWFADSELCAHLMKSGNAKKLDAWKKRIHGMAAPALTLNEEECNKTIAAIGKFEADAESMIGAQMISKLNARITALSKQDEEIEAV